ncbi:hypothetical protein MA16_Dca004762 [Dendrobium catenatum]|uniref:Endonuclease/exonuclease/phosphatase domain-containing protein n=1 Tax=Dendrobium catenatum TaxID=906689 RepID=A0A2I0VP10_9ASPA|nr:hypothetical protein MA16_Dca004762 [Dendrobium catenatum]
MGRLSLWEQIIDFATSSSGPWCVGGDFNIISNANERLGGSLPNTKSMDEFNSMISLNDLQDIGFFGSAFTWSRGNLWQQLDRILFNNDWIADFHMTHVQHLSRTASDHAPLLLTINANKFLAPSGFKFQNMWLNDDGFLNVIQENWHALTYPDNNLYGMDKLWHKIGRLKQVLGWWNKHVFKNLFINIKEAKNVVLELENKVVFYPVSVNISDLNNAKIKLSNLHDQEEIYWRQKSTTKFLVEGDRNTRFSMLYPIRKKLEVIFLKF